MTFITVYITAGQRLDRSFDFSKYFLLGSIYLAAAQFNKGGSACLVWPGYPQPCSGCGYSLWITSQQKRWGWLYFGHSVNENHFHLITALIWAWWSIPVLVCPCPISVWSLLCPCRWSRSPFSCGQLARKCLPCYCDQSPENYDQLDVDYGA